ncbi:MAG: TolB family protein [Candidatus Brocadiia bacterium]
MGFFHARSRFAFSITLAAFLLLAAGAHADWVTVRVTNTPDGADLYPKVGDNVVGWQAYVPATSTYDAMRWDPAGGVTNLSASPRQEAGVVAGGPYVVWHGPDPGGWTQVYVNDGVTSHQLTSGPTHSGNPVIRRSMVAWVDATSPYGAVYADDLDDPAPPVTIAPASDPAYGSMKGHADVSGNRVVWRARDEVSAFHDDDIFYYDGSGITNITNDDLHQGYPHLADSYILWSQWDGTEYDLVRYDPATHATTFLTTDTAYAVVPSNYSIDGDRFVFSGVPDGETDREIYYYDGATMHRLTDDGLAQGTPTLSGPYVVWEEWLSDTNSEIMVHNLDDDITTRLTTNDYKDYRPCINGTTIAWEGLVWGPYQRDSDLFVATLEAGPPVADPGGPYSGLWGDLLTLDARGSFDPDGQPVTDWEWDIEADGSVEYTTETVPFVVPGGWDWDSVHPLRLRVFAGGDWSEWAFSQIHVIPEPASLALLGGALAAIAARRRRRSS